MKPSVAVLLPAYRAEKTLARAVRSLLAQSHREWLAVIASDDHCDYLRLLSGQGLADARLLQVSTGTYGSHDHGARNRALEAAPQTPFLALLDADDAWAPEHLEALLPLAEDQGAAVCNTLTFDESGRAYKRAFPEAEAPFPMGPEDILTPRSPFFPVLRRELAAGGWHPLPFCSDVIFSLTVLSRARRAGGALVCHPAPLYHYYKTPGSITHSAKSAEVAEAGYRLILQKLEEGEFDLDPDVRRAAHAEFTANRRVNRVFARWLREGRCSSMEDFLDQTERGRAPWLLAEAAREELE